METPLDTHSVDRVSIEGFERLWAIFDLTKFKIRWVADYYIEAPFLHDAVELDEPMERFVIFAPLGISRAIRHVHSITSGQMPVKFGLEIFQPLTQRHFVLNGD